MEKVVRITGRFGTKKDIIVDAEVDIRKGESVYYDYCTHTVVQVQHDIEDRITYYICEQEL